MSPTRMRRLTAAVALEAITLWAGEPESVVTAIVVRTRAAGSAPAASSARLSSGCSRRALANSGRSGSGCVRCDPARTSRASARGARRRTAASPGVRRPGRSARSGRPEPVSRSGRRGPRRGARWWWCPSRRRRSTPERRLRPRGTPGARSHRPRRARTTACTPRDAQLLDGCRCVRSGDLLARAEGQPDVARRARSRAPAAARRRRRSRPASPCRRGCRDPRSRRRGSRRRRAGAARAPTRRPARRRCAPSARAGRRRTRPFQWKSSECSRTRCRVRCSCSSGNDVGQRARRTPRTASASIGGLVGVARRSGCGPAPAAARRRRSPRHGPKR